MKKTTIFLITLGVLLFISIIITLIGLKFVDNHEVGYKFNKVTGEITVLKRTGYHLTNPLTNTVNTIDLRPTQVCIGSNARVLNCKLVRFNPRGLKTFISWHGRGNYNIDPSRTITTDFEDLLMSYAYDDTHEYDFLIIEKEDEK